MILGRCRWILVQRFALDWRCWFGAHAADADIYVPVVRLIWWNELSRRSNHPVTPSHNTMRRWVQHAFFSSAYHVNGLDMHIKTSTFVDGGVTSPSLDKHSCNSTVDGCYASILSWARFIDWNETNLWSPRNPGSVDDHMRLGENVRDTELHSGETSWYPVLCQSSIYVSENRREVTRPRASHSDIRFAWCFINTVRKGYVRVYLDCSTYAATIELYPRNPPFQKRSVLLSLDSRL